MTSKEVKSGAERSWFRCTGVLLASGALALTACTTSGKTAATTEVQPPVATAPAPPDMTQSPHLVFDYLGQGSTIIEVYPGVSNSAVDTESNGTYNSGETVPAECKTEGRIIRTPNGDVTPDSTDWVRITGTPGQPQYASAVYTVDPGQLLSQLKPC